MKNTLTKLNNLSLLSALLSIFIGLSMPAYCEVISASKSGFIVENTITTSATKEATWRALVNNVNDWWPKDHTWWGETSTLSIDPTAGGCFCEFNNDKSAEHLRVTFVDPNKSMRLTGGLGPLQGLGMYGALSFTLTQEQGVTSVAMRYHVQAYYEDDLPGLARIVDQVQALQLNGLKSFLTPKDQESD